MCIAIETLNKIMKWRCAVEALPYGCGTGSTIIASHYGYIHRIGNFSSQFLIEIDEENISIKLCLIIFVHLVCDLRLNTFQFALSLSRNGSSRPISDKIMSGDI